MPPSLKTSEFINFLAVRYEARNYLEIGVQGGDTFFAVTMPHKVGIDPCFLFDHTQYSSSTQHLFPITSDTFFDQLSATSHSEVRAQLYKNTPSISFDIIFIDGQHTFEQSWRDFTNCLPYTHKNSIVVMDNTVPITSTSSHPAEQGGKTLVKEAQANPHTSHDVFKTIFAIHDTYPELSYCTMVEEGYSRTFIWRANNSYREPVFSSLEEIDQLSYDAMLRHAHLLMPVGSLPLLLIIGKTLTPQKYAHPTTWKKLYPDAQSG